MQGVKWKWRKSFDSVRTSSPTIVVDLYHFRSPFIQFNFNLIFPFLYLYDHSPFRDGEPDPNRDLRIAKWKRIQLIITSSLIYSFNYYIVLLFNIIIYDLISVFLCATAPFLILNKRNNIHNNVIKILKWKKRVPALTPASNNNNPSEFNSFSPWISRRCLFYLQIFRLFSVGLVWLSHHRFTRKCIWAPSATTMEAELHQK